MTAAEGGGIFISYRRQETSHLAGRLYDRLADRFGEGKVFIDVNAIEPGVDFAEEIFRAVAACTVLLAIIGPGWLTAADERGRRRLDDSDDIVRLEIEAALGRGVRVIPILVEGAVMPARDDLPETLAGLARRNALLIRHETLRYDAGRLVAAIERALAAPGTMAVSTAPSPRPADDGADKAAQKDQEPARTDVATAAGLPADPGDTPAVRTAADTSGRVSPSMIEWALSGPSKDRDLSWPRVRTVTGAGGTQERGARDQEALDRARARLPLSAAKRILVLGCTNGAGQTVTTMMTGHILATLREHPVAAVDLHDGTLARYSAPAAWLDEILGGKTPQQPAPGSVQGRLDVIASHDPLRAGDEIKLAAELGRHYPLTMLDPAPAGLTKLLKITDQLVVVVAANPDAAGALADTRDWLDAHGFADLAARSVTLINGISRRSLADAERAESVAHGRCRAIVRIPFDDTLPIDPAGSSEPRPQTRVAYTALAGVLIAGMAAAPVRTTETKG